MCIMNCCRYIVRSDMVSRLDEKADGKGRQQDRNRRTGLPVWRNFDKIEIQESIGWRLGIPLEKNMEYAFS